jgi:hypothetical protein
VASTASDCCVSSTSVGATGGSVISGSGFTGPEVTDSASVAGRRGAGSLEISSNSSALQTGRNFLLADVTVLKKSF